MRTLNELHINYHVADFQQTKLVSGGSTEPGRVVWETPRLPKYRDAIIYNSFDSCHIYRQSTGNRE